MASAAGCGATTRRAYRDFTQTVITSEQLFAALKQKQLPHETVRVTNGFWAKTFEEMYTLCRFFVLEDCSTPAQLAALSEEEARQLDAKIRLHTERCRGPDGVYRLEQDEDIVILPRP